MTVLGAIFKAVSEAAIEPIDASLAVVLDVTSDAVLRAATDAVLDVTPAAILRAASDAVFYAVFYAVPTAVFNAVFTASSMHLRCLLAAVSNGPLMHP